MSVARNALSLCGAGNFLLAIGGWREKDLGFTEKYYISTNRWRMLPPLLTARQCPGSYVVSSQERCFCFCGYANEAYTNVVETLNLNELVAWKPAKLGWQPPPTNHLVAMKHGTSVVLFGGDEYSTYCMFVLDEEGELMTDLSHLEGIPGNMCRGTAIMHGDHIYALGSRKEWNWQWRKQRFDGEWKVI